LRPVTLDDFDGPFRLSGDEVNFRNCPICKDSRWKIYVNSSTGFWVCFAGDCNSRGRIDIGSSTDSLLRRISDARNPQPTPAPWNWPDCELPETYALTAFQKPWNYLMQRGYNIPQNPYHLRITRTDVFIPYFGKTGEVIYWSMRDVTGSRATKYLNMPGRHPLYVPAFSCGVFAKVPRLVVVEGAFDAMQVHAAGYACTALGGTSLPRYLRGDLTDLVTERVTVMLDSDALSRALKIEADLQDQVPADIAMCVRGRDPGSMSVEEIRVALD